MNEAPPSTPPHGLGATPPRNGGGDRLDDLADSVQLLTQLVHRAITASESAARSSDSAVIGSRENAGSIGRLAAEVSSVKFDVRQIKETMVGTKALMKRLAERVVNLEQTDEQTDQRISKAEFTAALAKQSADASQNRPAVQIINDIPTPQPPAPTTEPPSAIRPFVSRSFYRRHKTALTLLAVVIATAWGLWQTIRR